MRRSKPAGAWMLNIRTGRSLIVAEAVLDARRHEHERAGRSRHLAASEQERHLALDDVERVVLILVDVGLELAAGSDLDDPEREARRVGGASEELDVAHAVALAGRDDDRLGLHRPIPSRREPARDARCSPGMTARLIPLLVVLAALVVAPPAAAKEITAVKACGDSGCVTTKDPAILQGLMNGGPPTVPPDAQAPAVRLTATITEPSGDVIGTVQSQWCGGRPARRRGRDVDGAARVGGASAERARRAAVPGPRVTAARGFAGARVA